MAKIRELALKLFAKVYGIKTATTYLVKKQFPKFRASNKDHWEFLILKLLKIYRERQPESFQPTQEQILKMSNTELANYASSRGINPNQLRFKLLRELGVKSEKLKNTMSLTSRRGRYIPEWNGKLGFG